MLATATPCHWVPLGDRMAKYLIFSLLLFAGCYKSVLRFDAETEAAFQKAVAAGDPIARYAASCYDRACIHEGVAWTALGITVTSFSLSLDPPSADTRHHEPIYKVARFALVSFALSIPSPIVGAVYTSKSITKGNRAKRQWLEAYRRETFKRKQ
jgi:hypothetical protein